ncbi:recombination regulator RecX [Evansella cellulosilytica]|uniref:Regulatory protein RecX n=1 Tax=Evansella cellulosilytica (strain ATCC 21833 / DSM 2522 / FERM P-1141 / JCM 9156 / N-4) TaxID=649639 RepID=E6U1Z1_EVAC2|nr:recombination regulator RecX [Evansella cellulosilytica]ADU29235.1 regulatory protein RecX [Evansella cellulosilytica DSM 2522]
MPKITKITPAKRSKARFHIYIDKGEGEEYAFSVSEDVFIKHHLSKGKELSQQEIANIREEDVLDKAFQKTLNYISYRMRSEKEVFTYLKDLEISPEDAHNLIDRLKDLNVLDDLMFAEAFVRTKKNTQKKGPFIIEQELYEKGISQKHIDQAMKQYPMEEQLENAMVIISKKKSGYKSDSQKQKKQKMHQFLLQRGFSTNVAKEAIEESDLDNSFNEDLEWQAIAKQGEKALRKFMKYENYERDMRIKQFLYQKGFQIDLIDKWINERVKEEG